MCSWWQVSVCWGFPQVWFAWDGSEGRTPLGDPAVGRGCVRGSVVGAHHLLRVDRVVRVSRSLNLGDVPRCVYWVLG